MAKLNIKPVTKERLTEIMLKGKTQVKFFQVGNPDVAILEDEINQFLKEKGDKISVKDIKLCTNNNNSPWTAMVIYEVK